jgi:predicted nucleic acid binding AN1-type Zn finger protein
MNNKDNQHRCSYCGKNTEGLSHKCKFCGQIHCSDHLLPENHDCQGVSKYYSNAKKWMSNYKEKGFKRKRRKNKSYDAQSYMDNVPILGLPYKERKSKNKAWKTIKKNMPIILLIIFFGGIIFYTTGTPIPFIKTCEDGTWENYCSSDKPFYCNNQVLVENASHCGCEYGYKESGNTCEKIPTCVGGIFYNECSTDKPFYCDDGALVQRASLCGCPREEVREGERCISKYETNPNTVKLSGVGSFEVYQGLNDYLAGLDRSINYYDNEPTTKDFVLKSLDNEIQKSYLDLLVEKIKEKSEDVNKQARIAISLVQSIPYDWSAYESNNIDARYPYEVLYDMEGVCMEKSDLLAYLLRGFGFGVAIFEYEHENHRAVGILCDNGNYNTDYCFIESTDHYPVGQIPNNYVGGADIKNANPEVVVISQGRVYN